MSRSARLLDLVHLLSGRRSYRVEEIADRFEISVRTAYRDLADLSERHIPVYHDDHGYRLLETATLRPLNLTAEEHGLLKVALHNPALRHQDTLRKTLDALEAKLDAASALTEETPQALQLAGLDRSGPNVQATLGPLGAAIRRRRSIDMRYQSLSGRHGKGDRQGKAASGKTAGKSGHEADWRRLDPWQLFERAEAWYVVGHCHRNAEPRLFRVDRIDAVREREESFEVPTDFDLDRYLESAWNVIVGDRPHDIHLRFAPGLAPLLLNARHHPGETVAELEDGTIDYRVRLSSLAEITGWIVLFGNRCRVLEPPELVDAVRNLALGVLAEEKWEKW